MSTLATTNVQLGLGALNANLTYHTANTTVVIDKNLKSSGNISTDSYFVGNGSLLSGVVSYSDTTANFTGTLQQNGSNVLTVSTIGSTVQAYDANILFASNIGTTVQAYDANILFASNIGTTVQAYDANILFASNIGTTVQAYDANTAKLDVAQSFTAQQTFAELKETVFTLATSGTVDLNPANGSIQTTSLSNNITFTESLESGQSVVLHINGGASYTVTFPTTTWVTSAGNTAPTLTANDTTVFWKISNTLYGAYVGSYA